MSDGFVFASTSVRVSWEEGGEGEGEACAVSVPPDLCSVEPGQSALWQAT